MVRALPNVCFEEGTDHVCDRSQMIHITALWSTENNRSGECQASAGRSRIYAEHVIKSEFSTWGNALLYVLAGEDSRPV